MTHWTQRAVQPETKNGKPQVPSRPAEPQSIAAPAPTPSTPSPAPNLGTQVGKVHPLPH